MPEYLSFSPDMSPKESSSPISLDRASEHTSQPERHVESPEEVKQDISRFQRVIKGIQSLLKRASSGASMRTASLLRIGGVLIALGAGTAGSVRDAHAEEIHYPEVGGIHLPEGETIPIYPDQRLEAAQKFLAEARKELGNLQKQEKALEAPEKNPDVAYVTEKRLRENLRKQQNLISTMAEREALVDQLSQTIEDQDAKRVEGLLEQANELRGENIKKVQNLFERARDAREGDQGEKAHTLEKQALGLLSGTSAIEKQALVSLLSQTLHGSDLERIKDLLAHTDDAPAKGKIEKAKKLEEQAGVHLYGTANAEIDVYMASIGIREQGRRIAMYSEAGNIQVFTIAPGLQPDGFYQDKRHDMFTIVLKSPTYYYGFFLKEGKLFAHGACREDGRPLTP